MTKMEDGAVELQSWLVVYCIRDWRDSFSVESTIIKTHIDLDTLDGYHHLRKIVKEYSGTDRIVIINWKLLKC